MRKKKVEEVIESESVGQLRTDSRSVVVDGFDEFRSVLSVLVRRVDGIGVRIDDGFRELCSAVSGILDAESLKSSYADLLSEYEDLKSEHDDLEVRFAGLVDENDVLRERVSSLECEMREKSLKFRLKKLFCLG